MGSQLITAPSRKSGSEKDTAKNNATKISHILFTLLAVEYLVLIR